MSKVGEVANSVRIQELEEQVAELSRQLRDHQKLKEQLAQSQKRESLISLSGGIAHDFNNILHCILGYTELAILNNKNGPTDVEILQKIQAVVQRGCDLTRQFLMFGRETPHRLEELSFNTVIEDVMLLLLRTIPRNIAIRRELAHDLSAIVGDSGQCEQVVMNLCLNAMDAMPEGGTLLIQTKNMQLSHTNRLCVEHGVSPGSYVRLRVSDTGIGMGERVLGKIFDPFYTTKQKGEGSGLGLSVVSSIVKSHGGAIDCTSMVGSGSTFDMYFPAIQSNAQEQASAENSCLLGNVGGGEVILFIEDEEDVVVIGKHFLEGCGYTVLTARDCQQGLNLYQQHSVDLVVMDVGLPGMGAADFLRSLQEKNSEVRVLVISGYPATSETIEDLKLKEGEFLQKPFSCQEFARRVRLIFDGHPTTVHRPVHQEDLRA